MAEPGVGSSPNVACEFKRADFLEGEAIETSLLIGTELVQSESGLCTGTASGFYAMRRFGEPSLRFKEICQR